MVVITTDAITYILLHLFLISYTDLFSNLLDLYEVSEFPIIPDLNLGRNKGVSHILLYNNFHR